MTLLLAFTVPGSPVPMARARKGAGDRWYTPGDGPRYKKLVARCARFDVDITSATDMWNSVKKRPGLAELYAEPAIRVVMRFYFPDRRHKDLDNLQKSVLDALVQGELIREDNWRVVRKVDASADYDKLNARAEIEIYAAEPPTCDQPKRKRR